MFPLHTVEFLTLFPKLSLVSTLICQPNLSNLRFRELHIPIHRYIDTYIQLVNLEVPQPEAVGLEKAGLNKATLEISAGISVNS